MNSNFWRYTIWYIILVIICITLVITAAAKSINWKQTIAAYFTFVGIAYHIELFILVIFKGYSYYPMMMKESFDDSMMGNVISQTLIASCSLIIAVKDLSFIWYAIFSAMQTIIEVLFLKLGIYEHYWYRTWFTTLGLLAYFWITKKWYRKITSSPTRKIAHISLYLSVFSVYSPCIEWTLRIMGIYQFKIDLLGEPIRNHINDYVVYIFFILNLIIILYKSKVNFFPKLSGLLSIYFINYLLVEFNILYIKPGWFLIYSTIVILINYLLVALFDRMFDFKIKSM